MPPESDGSIKTIGCSLKRLILNEGHLRVCQNTECRTPLNRDKNGATNIGTNFKRLFSNQSPIREMTDEDLALHRTSLCVLCDDE